MMTLWKCTALKLCGLIICMIGSVVGASAEDVRYASADGKGGWLAGNFIPARTLPEVMKDFAGKTLKVPTTIQLLTSEKNPARPTVFQNRTPLGECSFALSDLHGAKDASLTIKGVKDKDTGRYLTQLQGNTIQEVIDKKHRCKQSGNVLALESLKSTDAEPDGDARHPEDLLADFGQQQAYREDNAGVLSIGMQKNLVRCFRIERSEWVNISDIAFKDCWLPAVFARDSSHISLSDSQIEGSSYAFFAMSTKDPEKARGFKIENNLWVQDTTGYGKGKPAECATPSKESDCPGDMWSKIRWAVTHDLEFEYMNGALFGGIDVAGEVSIIGNTLRNAYNGVRMIPKKCTSSDCLKTINRDVEIADNNFVYIRDNPIEPEDVAWNWRIHGNDFKNSHGWISLDGNSGGPVYVYANTGWYTDIPSRECDPELKPAMHMVDFINGGWTNATTKEDIKCTASTFGTVMKVGSESNINGVYVFHNSWSIRSPLVRGGVTGPIHHWNNAINFMGCGTKGDPMCAIQTSSGDPDCDFQNSPLVDVFTPGDQSLVFRCVTGRQVADAAIYDFAYDISSQGFPASMKAEIAAGPGAKPTDPMFAQAGDFHLQPNSPAIGAGCIVMPVREDSPDLVCKAPSNGQVGEDIGAFTKDGQRYQPPEIP